MRLRLGREWTDMGPGHGRVGRETGWISSFDNGPSVKDVISGALERTGCFVCGAVTLGGRTFCDKHRKTYRFTAPAWGTDSGSYQEKDE